MADEPIDLGDAKQVDRKKKDSKQDQLQRVETIKKIMQDENVRKWFYEVLVMCQIGRNPFSSDALLMAHSCGEMNIGLQLRAALEFAAPEMYLQMMRENNG